MAAARPSREESRAEAAAQAGERDRLEADILTIQDFAGYDAFQKAVGVAHIGGDDDYDEHNPKPGIYFHRIRRDTGHWYAYVGRAGRLKDGCEEGHMAPGSQGFCQTFALIYHLEDLGFPAAIRTLARLRPYLGRDRYDLNYSYNAKNAVRFIIQLLRDRDHDLRASPDINMDEVRRVNIAASRVLGAPDARLARVLAE